MAVYLVEIPGSATVVSLATVTAGNQSAGLRLTSEELLLTKDAVH